MSEQGWRQWGLRILVALLLVGALAADSSVWAQLPGDVNCDGSVDRQDLLAAAQRLFAGGASACGFADQNFDLVLSAADFPALAGLVAAPPALGPEVTYLGLAAADGSPLSRTATIAGVPVYARPAGQGFKLVIEARPGAAGVSVGQTIFASDPRDPTVRPDLWILVSRPLGDGSPAVCDGGVPAVHPPDLRPLRRITDAMNDLSCNFAVATAPAFACTSDRFGRATFVNDATQVQFCLQVTRQLIFSDGETLVTVAVRDRAGNLGPLTQIRLRVGPGPSEPTPTATPSPSATLVRVSPSRTRTPTATWPPSPTATGTPPATPTRTHTLPPSPTPTHSIVIPTATATRTMGVGSATVTASPTGSVSLLTATAAATASLATTVPTRTPTATLPVATTARPLTPTSTPSRTRTRSATPVATPTRSATATPTRTATHSPTAPPGPVIRYFGLTRSDDTLLDPVGTTPQGVPIFVRPQGFGFNIVVEAARGPSGNEVGSDTFVPSLVAMPDLQIVASRPLGDGSDAACDNSGPSAGGVPALDPPSYLPTETNIRIMNDFGCRFVDGAGTPRGRGSQEACTRVPPELDFRFVGVDTSVQFCAPVTRILEFPPGDTVLTVRVLDQAAADAPPGSGVPGPTAQIVVRVGSGGSPTATPSPTATATRSRTPTRTATLPATVGSPSPTSGTGGNSPKPTRTTVPASPTRTPSRTPSSTPTESPGPTVTFFGVARADGSLLQPDNVSAGGVPIYSRPLGAGFLLVVEAKPGPSGAAVGLSTFQADLSGLPDLQVVASRALGNGSEDVCDYRPPTAGGVPATDPPRFDDVAAVNDLSCRFRDGADEPRGRGLADACVLFGTGAFGFVRAESTVQFCAFVDRAWEFPPGDTLMSVRVRDTNGATSSVAQLIVRVTG
ncbi:MAG: hypothetical protein N3C12_00500 [Candidatus Binatia bacterium]|nr:hypothetical protein [Candidatus Binatia bacterium]